MREKLFKGYWRQRCLPWLRAEPVLSVAGSHFSIHRGERPGLLWDGGLDRLRTSTWIPPKELKIHILKHNQKVY